MCTLHGLDDAVEEVDARLAGVARERLLAAVVDDGDDVGEDRSVVAREEGETDIWRLLLHFGLEQGEGQ